MSAQFLALAGPDSDSEPFWLLEDSLRGVSNHLTGATVGTLQVVSPLDAAVAAWVEYDTRIGSSRDVHGVRQRDVDRRVLTALWEEWQRTPACPPCAATAAGVNEMNPVDGANCAQHRRSLCQVCQTLGVFVEATWVRGDDGYCDRCGEIARRRALAAS